MFPQWNQAIQFNQIVKPNPIQSVLLLHRTRNFNVIQDLSTTLRITKRPQDWFIRRFKDLGVVVEYATVFTIAEIQKLGPISSNVSDKICEIRISNLYPDRSLQIVSVNKEFGKFKHLITPEQFSVKLSEWRNSNEL